MGSRSEGPISDRKVVSALVMRANLAEQLQTQNHKRSRLRRSVCLVITLRERGTIKVPRRHVGKR